MWRTRGPRPCRSPRCCSAKRVIIRRAVKSQLHDGRVAADPPSAHVDESRSGLGLQVSIQHLRPANIQHALSLHGPASSSDGADDVPALELQERPAGGDGGESSCDCPPSASTSGRTADGSTGNGRWRSSHAMNSRDAAALTRRITHTRSTSELQGVVQQFRAQLNPIHIAAAIVKLAKLTAAESGRQRQRHGLLPPRNYGQRDGKVETDGWPADAAAAAAGEPAAARDAASDGDSGLARAPASAADGQWFVPRRDINQDEEQASSSSRNMSNGSASSSSSKFVSENSDTRSSSDQISGAARRSGVGPLAAPGGSGLDTGLPPDAGPLEPHPLDRARQRPLSGTPPPPSSSAALLADLVSGFLGQLPHYSARQYANVVWALAAMGNRDHPELLAAAAAQLQAQGAAKLLVAPPQELSNLALGLAKLGYREVSLWGALIVAGKRRLHEFKPQELHNMAWAVAAASQDRSMISATVQAALPRLAAFNASGLSNLLWACATAQCHCEELFDGAAVALMALPPEEVNSQDVANAAWACAKLQHSHPPLMAHLARLVLMTAAAGGSGGSGGRGLGLRAAATQELVNTLWAFAVVPPPRWLPLSLPQAPGRRARSGGDGGGAVARGMVGEGDGGAGLLRGDAAAALGAGGLGGAGLLTGGGEGVLRTAGRAHEPQWQSHSLPAAPGQCSEPGAGSGSDVPSGLSSSPQAQGGSSTNSSGEGRCFSRSDSTAGSGGGGSLLESAIQVLVSELSWRPDLTPQGSANALWACARLQPCPLPPAGLAALLTAAGRTAHRMGNQELCNTLWAAGELRNAGLFLAYGDLETLFGAACCAARLEGMAPAGLAQLFHAAVALRRVHSGHMDLLAQQVMARLPALGPQELCVMAVAVAEAVRYARYCNPILLNGLANAAVLRVGDLCPQGISTLLWSFARAKHYHGPLTTTLCRAAKPRLREFSDMEISNLVWALAVLKCQDRQLLVAAARVMVERVRLRRQRRAAAVDTGGAMRSTQRQHLLRGLPKEDAGKGERWRREEQDSEWLLSDREEMASTSASHWQQRRRRRQQEEQQQQQGLAAGVAADGVERSEAAATAWGAGTGAWRTQQYGMELRGGGGVLPAGAVSTAVASSEGDGGTSTADDSGMAAIRVGVLPGNPATAAVAADEPVPSQLEAQLRLRRLPVMHHSQDDSDAPLQPRRPPPRDAHGDVVTGSSPRCTVSADVAALPQRAAALLSADDADGADGGSAAAPTPLDHAKSLSKLLWSYAKCNLYNQSLFRLLVQELTPVLRHTNPHELTLALWAVACHGHRCPELLEAAADLLLRGGRLQELCPWDASVVAWVFAKLRHPHGALFEALQAHAIAAGGDYKEPCVVRLAWACAALEVPLRGELVRRVVEARQRARRRVAQSSYDGADGEAPASADAAHVEGEW